MKKLYFFVILFCCLSTSSFAQNFGNEWINYNQPYYQFKIVAEGIYKIDFETLQSNGINLPQNCNPGFLQLFGREREQPIMVFDGGDGIFGPTDYFIFYAERNDGWKDSSLFSNPGEIGNPGYSMFNDTINYFFSWNTSTNNLRYFVESTPASSPFLYANCMAKSEIYGVYGATTYHDPYMAGQIALSEYGPGEGYYVQLYDKGTTINYNFPTPNRVTGSGAVDAKFHSKVVSASNASSNELYKNHHINMTLGTFNFEVEDSIYGGYQQIITNKVVPSSYLDVGSTNFKFYINDDLGALTDYQALSYASLYYNRTTSFNGSNKDKFWIKNPIFDSHVHLNLTSTSITSPIVMVFGDKAKFVFTQSNGAGNWRVLVSKSENSAVDQKVIVQDASLIQAITSLSPVNGTGQFTDYAALDFEAANILVYHPSLGDVNAQYQIYRQQSYNSILVNIEELYLQFGGGIQKHNAALRKFSEYIYTITTSKPIALTLLGKGYTSKMSRANSANFAASLIPAYGIPGSDVCHTSGLQGSGFAPLIPTGRIAAKDSLSLSDYLYKLIDYEDQQNQSDPYSTETKDWQKQVLHFSGGANTSQQGTFLSYMNGFKSIIERSNYAGNVTTYRKISSDPLDPSLLGKLSEQLKSGVSLMTFFGHSSSTGFDLNIDEPQNWENMGKYPVVVGNGCYSGDMYSNPDSFSEKLVSTPNEGAIAFIASSASEVDIVAQIYCTELYNQFSPKNYGMPIGYQMKKAVEVLQSSSNGGWDDYLKSTYGAVNLNGDPLLKLNWHTKPELEIRESSLFFEPSKIDLSVDTITVNLVIKNLGRSVLDTFEVEIIRDFPNSTIDSVYRFVYDGFQYNDTISMKIPLQAQIAIGINKFKISVDIPDFVEELDEEYINNQLEKIFFLKVDGIQPIYPYEFAVVPNKDSNTVKASTIDPIAEMRTYHFEMDTSDKFDPTSPEFRKFSVTGLGGVKEVHADQWNDADGGDRPLVCKDSMVYFWRVALDSSIIVWNETSFQYIEGKSGWGQDHFFQFKKNNFYNVKYDTLQRLRTFFPVSKEFKAVNYDHADNNDEYRGCQYFIDGQNQEKGLCGLIPSIHIAVIDPLTFSPWLTRACDSTGGYNFGNINDVCACRARQEGYFIFRQDNADQLFQADSMLNAIPDGYYVLVYTTLFADYSNWSSLYPTLYQTMNNLGATGINSGLPEQAFIFFCRKGIAGSEELLLANMNDTLVFERTLYGANYLGQEVSPIIGPAAHWETVYWRQDSLELNTADSTLLSIDVIDFNGNVNHTIDTLFTHKDSILNLNNLVDAAQYPYLRLTAHYVDTFMLSPAQVNRWHVLYQPIPEAAIDGSNGYYLSLIQDSLNEGQELKFAVDIKNISDYAMDSLLVSYWIEDFENVRHPLPYPRQDSLLALNILRDTITFNTVGFPGNNSFWVEVNPYVNGSTVVTDQLEQYHFNNYLQIPFYVIPDDVNPILDVTFNGRHILNGDIVDPESEIVISLKDDNQYQIMDDISDTALFGIYLTSPDGIQRKISFEDVGGNPILQWIPAESNFKKFKIIYPAIFQQDGVYTLLVQGTDRSGNLSGDIEYRISFEVIHESSITYMMNYPNPFSTSTRFVFTLTGSEVPDEFIIQIMTVTGKVVREITEDELGPLYIGRNITEYAWNGTDEFGDPLANGVYLYRVLTQINGEEVKHRDSEADNYFKKEFGKMYIMR